MNLNMPKVDDPLKDDSYALLNRKLVGEDKAFEMPQDAFQQAALPSVDFADAEKHLNYAHNIAILIKAAQDAAMFIEDVRHYLDSASNYDKAGQLTERVLTACEAIQSDTQDDVQKWL